MNKWVEKSIKLANSGGYLDNLFDIYPTDLGINRILTNDLLIKFKKDFKKKDKTGLIKDLLKFPKFPIDDPYIASLRKHSFLFSKNPKTIDRIGKRILSMDFNYLLKLSTMPQKPSRQLGHVFYDWLKKEKFKFLEENKFKSYNGAAFLVGCDKFLKNFGPAPKFGDGPALVSSLGDAPRAGRDDVDGYNRERNSSTARSAPLRM